MKALGASLLIFLGCAGAAQSETTSSQFTVSMNITKSCSITEPTSLTFTQGDSTTTVAGRTGTATFKVQCTNSTAYSIGLNDGLYVGSGTRNMAGPGNARIPYGLYQNEQYTTPWGNTEATMKGSQTGTGTATTHTVYGKVGSVQAPADGTYTDTVTITVTY